MFYLAAMAKQLMWSIIGITGQQQHQERQKHLRLFLTLLFAGLHRQLCFDILSDTTSLEGVPKMQVSSI